MGAFLLFWGCLVNALQMPARHHDKKQVFLTQKVLTL